MGCAANGVRWNMSFQQDQVLGRDTVRTICTRRNSCTADVPTSGEATAVFEDEGDWNTEAHLDAGSDMGVRGYKI